MNHKQNYQWQEQKRWMIFNTYINRLHEWFSVVSVGESVRHVLTSQTVRCKTNNFHKRARSNKNNKLNGKEKNSQLTEVSQKSLAPYLRECTWCRIYNSNLGQDQCQKNTYNYAEWRLYASACCSGNLFHHECGILGRLLIRISSKWISVDRTSTLNNGLYI